MPDDGHASTVPNTSPPAHVRSDNEIETTPDARYEMVALLGRGGMGEVWLAHDEHVDRDVAIKLMRGDLVHEPNDVARFLREARVQGQLEHPAIVPVHDIGGGDAPYFAMKRLTGITLADVLVAQAEGDETAQARWPRATLLSRLVDVCNAIELAHRRGVIHRDLKPANIMLGDFGETYVLDWGLARLLEGPELKASSLPSSGDGAAQTVAGAVMGTPGYMSPEQVRGEPVDVRTDVYALGCILHEILTGHPALPRDRAIEATLEATDLRPSRAARAVDIPPELDEITARATAWERAARVASAGELRDAVQRYLEGDRDVERRRKLSSELATRATRAFDQHRDAVRVDALREAGQALALDPTNGQAAALLARILLEPPREIPAAARAAIAAERDLAARPLIFVGGLVYVGFAVVAIVIKLLGAHGTWAFVALEAELALLAGMCFVQARRSRVIAPSWHVRFLTMHVALLATLGVATNPLVFVPMLMFGILPVAQTIPTMRRPVTAVVLLSLALLVPLALEWLGVVPASLTSIGDQLVLHTGAVTLSPHLLVATVVLLVMTQLIGVSATLLSQRREQERAQEQLHVHKWHFEQLLARTPAQA
jgi:eukaryotic-like serine/threonine-protein kinase